MGLLGVHYYFLRYGISAFFSLCSFAVFSLYTLKRKNIGWYLYFLIAVFSLLIELITSPLRGYQLPFIPGGGGIKLCSVVTFILYFVFIQLMLKKYTSKIKPQWILVACLLGSSILQVPIRLLPGTLGTLPDWLFHLFGIAMGYLFYKSNKFSIKSGIVVISIIFLGLLYVKGYDMWRQKLNFGTFTGKIESKQNYDLSFQTNSGDSLSLSDFKGKYLLLDCWYTYCGVCYQKMPKVQHLYDNYRQNPEINIFAVHCFIKKSNRNGISEDYTTGSEILKERGFSFPCLSIDIDNPVLKELGVNVYPTVLVFDKQSNLIFRGNIENASNYIKKLLQKKNSG